jgi:hypothetical protein
MSDQNQKKSWRDVFQIHPAAELFPPLPEDELRQLGENLMVKRRPEHPVIFWAENTETERMLLDGRSRLDAAELVGLEVCRLVDGEYRIKFPNSILLDEVTRYGVDPYDLVVSLNVHRRHLSKQQKADLIVQSVKQQQLMTSQAIARSFSPESGRRGGSIKDPFKEKVVERAAKSGISKRTAENALAKHRGLVFERKPVVDPLAEFNVKKVIEKILDMLEPASELEVRQVVNAIQKRFLVREAHSEPGRG